MNNKYYADACGADLKALVACIKKAFEIADTANSLLVSESRDTRRVFF